MQRILARAHLESLCPMSQSKFHQAEKEEGESHDAYEQRTWREKAHVDPVTGRVFIPPMSLKFCLIDGAKYLGEKVKGRGARPWYKHFEAGVMIFDPVLLAMKKDDLVCIPIRCHPEGKRAPGKRVTRYFPMINDWKGTASFEIFDLSITEEVFGRAIEAAGNYVGVGRFTPRVGGFNGRFKVNRLEWVKG